MRRLLLFRHAKAAVAAGHDDHERALMERGRRDAARVAAFIAASGLTPELVVHSGARRAQETAEIARAAWPRLVEARVEPRLYEASRPTVEAIVRALPDSCASVMVVGHNPSLADVANHLVGHGADFDLLRISAKFPTASLAALEFDVAHWRDVSQVRPSSPASPRPTTRRWRRCEGRTRPHPALRAAFSGKRGRVPSRSGYWITSQFESSWSAARSVLGVKPRPLRGCRFLAALTLRASAFMVFAAGSRPCGPASAKTMALPHRSAMRAAPEQPRSGLTATGRCGRRREMCVCSPLAGEGWGEGNVSQAVREVTHRRVAVKRLTPLLRRAAAASR